MKVTLSNMLNCTYIFFAMIILYVCLRTIYVLYKVNNIEGLENKKERINNIEKLVIQLKETNERDLSGLDLDKRKNNYVDLLTELEEHINITILNEISGGLTNNLNADKVSNIVKLYELRDKLPSSVDYMNDFSAPPSTSNMTSKITGMFS